MMLPVTFSLESGMVRLAPGTMEERSSVMFCSNAVAGAAKRPAPAASAEIRVVDFIVVDG